MKKGMLLLLTMALVVFFASCGSKQKLSNVDATSSQPTELSGSSSMEAPSSSEQAQKKDMDAETIVKALKDKGFPIDNIIVYTEEDDPNELLGRPNQYISKVNFADTTLEQFDQQSPVGGTIEVFKTEADAKSRFDYVDAINQKMPMVATYMYVNGTVLLRIEKSITPSKASEYEAAFHEILGD